MLIQMGLGNVFESHIFYIELASIFLPYSTLALMGTRANGISAMPALFLLKSA